LKQPIKESLKDSLIGYRGDKKRIITSEDLILFDEKCGYAHLFIMVLFYYLYYFVAY